MPLIYFPPRLIQTDERIADAREQIDEASDRYLDEGIAIVHTEEAVKDVHKVIEFERQFENLRSVQ